MTIDQFIKEMAEEKYPLDDPRKNMHHDNSGQYSRREAFSAGASAMIPIMEGFVEFIEQGYHAEYKNKKFHNWFDWEDGKKLTTHQLLELYLSTLKQKKI